MLKQAPANFYQYERDFKSFKNDSGKQLQYLKLIQPAQVAQVFKSDLEADTMLQIFATLKQAIADDRDYVVSFVEALQQVKPFELSCDFLMDDEKD